MSFRNDREERNDAGIGEEAAEWLLRLDEADPDSQGEYPDEEARHQAFYDWIGTSPEHLRVFLETVETHRRMQVIDARHAIKVDALLRRADVVPLRKDQAPPPARRLDAPAHGLSAPAQPPGFTNTMDRKRAPLRAVAAGAFLCLAVGLGGYWVLKEQSAYSTSVGEQRSTKLEDGSFIYLNTHSKVEVHFSNEARNVRLVRGEALFVVERDSSRPFTVTAGDTTVRAIGTQFNVRRRARGDAEVAVVEGSVQVTALDEHAGFPAQKLVAGEAVQVSQGKIAARSARVAAEALAWRQRRLVFHDARLVDVAAEFNRYNRTRIRIEGDAAKELLLSGIFDADRPQALMLYAAKSSELAVEPDGNDWVIRGR